MRNSSSITVRQLLAVRSILCVCLFVVAGAAVTSFAADDPNSRTAAGAAVDRQGIAKTPAGVERGAAPPTLESAEDWNRRLQERFASINPALNYSQQEYVIGSEDLLDINVFGAPEMNQGVRVSANGEISLPLLGAVPAAGLTARELETSLEELLHQRYMKDPHVSVFVRDMQSHPVSVMGAVRRPGTFQIRGNKTLLEVLSLAEGFADDAGENVIVLRRASQNYAPEFVAKADNLAEPSLPVQVQGLDVHGSADTDRDSTLAASQKVLQVSLKELLDSTDPLSNPLVYPGDIVKVSRAGVIYVVGAVARPGGFAMKTNEKISVLQAIALSEGLTRTAAKGGARIVRTDERSGTRTETPVDLGKVLSGKSPDPMLGSRDILFVPDSAAKTALSRSTEVVLQTLTGLAIFHW